MEFDSFDLHPSIQSGIKKLGYVTATPIQEQGIPPVLAGRDMMGLAQTGTGKTAVFVLPILQRLVSRSKGKIRALIVAPTRELAEQTHEFFVALGSRTDLRFITIYGGVKPFPQINKIKKGVDIIIACPGRLLDLVNQGIIDLSGVEILVLDEADRMFDMGFLPDMRRIIKHIPKKRQTLLFSATMPDDIRKLSQEILHDPVTVQIDHTVPLKTVSHALYPVPQHLKRGLLISILKAMDTDSVLVFTRTKHRAKRLGRQLEMAGYKATSLHGDLTQNKRQAALDGFRRRSFQILVATDIAARGIDVSSISHVINYDIPDTADAYTHRIGRTGRAAKTGDAFTFVTNEDEDVVRSIEQVLGAKVDRRIIEGFDYNKPVPTQTRSSRPPRRGRGQRPTQKRNGKRPPQRTTEKRPVHKGKKGQRHFGYRHKK